jgi:hypothetical protein
VVVVLFLGVAGGWSHAYGQPLNQIGRWLGPIPIGYGNQGIHTAVVRGPSDSTSVLLLGRGHNVLWRFRADASSSLPASNTLRRVSVSEPEEPATLFFCSGHASTGDGRLAVFGGTHHGAAGTPYVYTFDPLQPSHTAVWTKLGDMAEERWYPSVAELADGSIAVLGGQRFPLMQTFGGMTTGGASQEFRPYTLGKPGVWKTPLQISTPPAERSGHAACFDRGSVPGVRRMLVHGGQGVGGRLDDLLTLKRRSLNLNLGQALDDTAYTWAVANVDISAEGKPDARRHHTMTLTEHPGGVLNAYLIGGEASPDGTPSSDFIWRLERVMDSSTEWSWKWNKLETGVEIASGPSPSARWGHSVVFDPDDNRLPKRPKLILYGGRDGSTHYSDVWFLRLDTTPLTWEKLETPAAPGARAFHTAIMDVREANSPTAHSHEESGEPVACSLGEVKRMIVFGGTDGTNLRSEVLVLNRNKEGTEQWCWETATVAGTPPAARQQHTAIYDGGWNHMIVFGGEGAGAALLGDVWKLRLYEGLEWGSVAVEAPPAPLSARKGHTALFDGRYHFSIYPERFYATATGAPPNLMQTMESAPQAVPNYPYVFALPRPNESFFYGGPLGAGILHRPLMDPFAGDPTTVTWKTQTLANQRGAGSAIQHRAGRIMRSGALAPGDAADGNRFADTLRYVTPGNVLTDPISGWQDIDLMHLPRANHNLVAMPGGDVLVFGGLAQKNDLATGVRRPQQWIPGDFFWKDSLAPDPAVRNFHSTAVLLPDARVLSTGGDPPNPNSNNVTIFEPPYLFDASGAYAARPAVSRTPARIRYGQTFSVCTSRYASIQRVSLIRPGAVSHSFNMDQHHVDLVFTQDYYGAVVATSPADSFIAPPGDYLVFLIDAVGALRPPSVGRWVRLGEHVLTGATPDTLADFQPDLVSTSAIQVTWRATLSRCVKG